MLRAGQSLPAPAFIHGVSGPRYVNVFFPQYLSHLPLRKLAPLPPSQVYVTHAQILIQFFYSPLTLGPFSVHRMALAPSRLTPSRPDLLDNRTRNHDINPLIFPDHQIERARSHRTRRYSTWPRQRHPGQLRRGRGV